MKRKVLLLALVMLSTGCDGAETTVYYDQQLRREIFKECLASIPKGPERIDNSNDWQEVVEECGDQAKSMAAYDVAIPTTGSGGYYYNDGIKGAEKKERKAEGAKQ